MPASARRRRLMVMTKNDQNPASAEARIGADRVAARFGCALTHAVPEEPDDVEDQHALLRAVHAERPDAVLIAPAHATRLNGTLRAMQKEAIRILCFVSRPDAFEPACFVGSDDGALARPTTSSTAWKGADALFRWMAIPTPSQRRRAPNASARPLPSAGMWASERATGLLPARRRPSRHARTVEAEARIDGVLAANDAMALGALDAMREAGGPLPIVGINATPEGVAAIKAGELLASAAFDAIETDVPGRRGCSSRPGWGEGAGRNPAPCGGGQPATAAPGTRPTCNARSRTGRSTRG